MSNTNMMAMAESIAFNRSVTRDKKERVLVSFSVRDADTLTLSLPQGEYRLLFCGYQSSDLANVLPPDVLRHISDYQEWGQYNIAPLLLGPDQDTFREDEKGTRVEINFTLFVPPASARPFLSGALTSPEEELVTVSFSQTVQLERKGQI